MTAMIISQPSTKVGPNNPFRKHVNTNIRTAFENNKRLKSWIDNGRKGPHNLSPYTTRYPLRYTTSRPSTPETLPTKQPASHWIDMAKRSRDSHMKRLHSNPATSQGKKAITRSPQMTRYWAKRVGQDIQTAIENRKRLNDWIENGRHTLLKLKPYTINLR